jgi:hypothetical protein
LNIISPKVFRYLDKDGKSYEVELEGMKFKEKKPVVDLGQEMENKHLLKGIWDKENKYPLAACFKLTKGRLLFATPHHLLVKDNFKENDEEIVNLVKDVTEKVKKYKEDTVV